MEVPLLSPTRDEIMKITVKNSITEEEILAVTDSYVRRFEKDNNSKFSKRKYNSSVLGKLYILHVEYVSTI